MIGEPAEQAEEEIEEEGQPVDGEEGEDQEPLADPKKPLNAVQRRMMLLLEKMRLANERNIHHPRR